MTSLQIPPDTWKIRNLLFEMPVPFSMRADVFEKYWSLVDNIWSRYDEMNVMGRGVDCTSPSNPTMPKLIAEQTRYLMIQSASPAALLANSRTNPPAQRRRRRDGEEKGGHVAVE
jgi:hypothetical protein